MRNAGYRWQIAFAAAAIVTAACVRAEQGRPAAQRSVLTANAPLQVWQSPYTFGDKVLLNGRTDPRATVQVNGRRVRVDRGGAFSAYVAVTPRVASEAVVTVGLPSGRVITRRVSLNADPPASPPRP